MEKPFYAFLVSLGNLLLVYIVFANFLGWSGGAINVIGTSSNDWQNSYVGFQSLVDAVHDFDNVYNADTTFGSVFHFNKLLDYTGELINTIFLGIPQLIEMIGNGSFSVFDIVKVVFNFFAQPLVLLGWSVMILGCVVYFFMSFITVVFAFFGGKYNIQYDDNNELWNQWSSIVDEWDWSNVGDSWQQVFSRFLQIV